MHPGTLVTNVGHIDQIRVEARSTQTGLEKWLVGKRCACCNHNPVGTSLADGFTDLGDIVLRAGVQGVLGMDDSGQGIGISGNGVNIEETGNVGATVADEDGSADLLLTNIAFDRVFGCPGQAVTPGSQQATGLNCSGTRLDQ